MDYENIFYSFQPNNIETCKSLSLRIKLEYFKTYILLASLSVGQSYGYIDYSIQYTIQFNNFYCPLMITNIMHDIQSTSEPWDINYKTKKIYYSQTFFLLIQFL